MAGITGGALLLAICLLHFHFGVEGGLMKPQKLAKHDYTIELEKVEVISPAILNVDPKTLFYSEMYNDTTRVLHFDLYIVEDFSEDVLMNTVVSKFEPRSNKWLEVVKRSDPLCNYLGESSTLIKDIFIKGNVTHGCPLRKGYYYVRNYLQPADEFPLHLDEGHWLVKMFFMTNNPSETLYAIAITVWINPIDDEE